jgi:hypothetical protein
VPRASSPSAISRPTPPRLSRNWAKAVVQDIVSYERTQETLALLRILALANNNIEQGHYRPARDVFADLRKQQQARKTGK